MNTDVVKVRRAEFEALVATLPEPEAQAFRDAVIPEPTTEWATGWYRRKRHVVDPRADRSRGEVRALCSPYTYVYLEQQRGGRLEDQPLPNSEAVLDLPACKLCSRSVPS